MIEITPSLQLDESELQFDFIRAAGPGGQNVNKVATAVQLRWDVRATAALTPEVKERLIKLAGSRMTADGLLLIEAKRHRTQEQNRVDAIQRLITLIQRALEKPNIRRATRPSRSAKAARMSDKRKHGDVKRTRRLAPKDWE